MEKFSQKNIDKIYKILEKFLFNKSKLWDIDTNVWNTWHRFIENLKNEFEFDDFDFVELDVVPVDHPKNSSENYYLVKINNIDVTPKKPNKSKGWSAAGVRQFLQECSYFGIVIYSNENFREGAKFKITSKIGVFLEQTFSTKKNNISSLLLHSIADSSFSLTKHIVNFGLSLFLSIIYEQDFSAFEKFPGELILSWSKNKKNKRDFSTSDLICRKNLEIIYKKTYCGLVRQITEAYTFEDIVSYLYSHMDLENSFLADEKYIRIDEEQKKFKAMCIDARKNTEYFYKKLDVERGKLREVLINERAGKLERYCDICMSEEPFMQTVQAAHIVPVAKIRDQLKNALDFDVNLTEEIGNAIIKQASDASNGLLLPESVHTQFDHGMFYFNLQGKLIYQEENRELMKSLKIEDSSIKKEILTDKMISFLKKRDN